MPLLFKLCLTATIFVAVLASLEPPSWAHDWKHALWAVLMLIAVFTAIVSGTVGIWLL